MIRKYACALTVSLYSTMVKSTQERLPMRERRNNRKCRDVDFAEGMIQVSAIPGCDRGNVFKQKRAGVV